MDRQGGVIHVPQDSKTGTRAIPIGETVREILDGQVRHLRSPFVFVDSTGKDYTSPQARNRVSRATLAVMRKAGIADASFHTLRHTAAAWMVQAGVPLYEVQHILGHSTPVMTQRYAHLQPGHLKNAMSKLDAALKAPATSTATRPVSASAGPSPTPPK